MDYRSVFLDQLRGEQKRLNPVKEIVANYGRLTRELLTAQRKLEEAQVSSPVGDAVRDRRMTMRADTLQDRLDKVQDKLTSTLSEQSDLRKESMQLQKDNVGLKERVASLEEEVGELKELIEQGKVEKSEMLALMKHTESRMDVTKKEMKARENQQLIDREKAARLQNDNDSLLNRMLGEKAQMMEELMKMTEMLDTKDTKIKQLELELKAARSGKEGVILSELAKIGGSSGISNMVRPPKKLFRRLEDVHAGEVNCIVPDHFGGVGYLTASNDKTVKLWDGNSQALLQTYTGPTASVMRCAFSPSGDRVMGASNDHGIYVWQKGGRLQTTLTGHTEKVWGATFSPDGAKMVSGSHDRTIKYWDLNASGRCVRTQSADSSVTDMVMGMEFVISSHLDNNIRFWDHREHKSVNIIEDAHDLPVTSVTVNGADGHQLLSFGRDHKLNVFDLRNMKPIHSYTSDDVQNVLNYSKPCFSPDGQFIAAGCGGRANNSSVVVFDTVKHKQVSNLTQDGHKGCITSCSWTPDGGLLISAGLDKSCICWSPE